VPSSMSPRGEAYWGDVFIMKLAPEEWGLHGWAVYEDVLKEFLELPVMRSGNQGYRRGFYGR
jgi:hypothetical protein